jgi:hypothetical protein
LFYRVFCPRGTNVLISRGFLFAEVIAHFLMYVIYVIYYIYILKIIYSMYDANLQEHELSFASVNVIVSLKKIVYDLVIREKRDKSFIH